MPTYAYRCKHCSHEFEQFQSITAKPIRRCPQCGKSSVQRLLGTGAGILFKGSGFYQTDYRTDTYKTAAQGDKGPSAGKGKDKDSPPSKTSAAKTPEAAGTKAVKKSA